jgi:two-component system, cell cycle response regulator
LRVLIAEDDPISRRILESTLRRWDYDVAACSDGDDAWEVLDREDPPKLAILDWMLPGRDGVQLCRDIRARAREPYIYTILLTARTGREDFIEGMSAGADDYVVKPCDPHELKVRLRAGRRILELQEELIAAREALRDQATHDPLTRLSNRGVILEMLQRELDCDRREGNPLSVVMLDLDRFKLVNDTHGHIAGDGVLRETARRLRGSLRAYDLVGRYGGEEFLIVLPGCDGRAAMGLAERVRVTISGTPMDTSEGAISVTCSLGVATGSGSGRVTAEDLIRVADEALYRAKRLGRDRAEIGGDLVTGDLPPEPCPSSGNGDRRRL